MPAHPCDPMIHERESEKSREQRVGNPSLARSKSKLESAALRRDTTLTRATTQKYAGIDAVCKNDKHDRMVLVVINGMVLLYGPLASCQ